MNQEKSTTPLKLDPLDLHLDAYTQIKPGLTARQLMDGVNNRFLRLRTLSTTLAEAIHGDYRGLDEAEVSEAARCITEYADECHTFVTVLWEVMSAAEYHPEEQ